MTLFHRHCWVEVRRRFVPPMMGEVEATGVPPDVAREWTQGVTVLELRCSGCGDVQERKLSGDGR